MHPIIHPTSTYNIVDRKLIRIEFDGRVTESVIDNLKTCPWEYQERVDKLPTLETFQTMESNIFWFENNKGHRCCATLDTEQQITIYVATKAVKCVADVVLRAGVLNDRKWIFTETNCEVSTTDSFEHTWLIYRYVFVGFFFYIVKYIKQFHDILG